jgi:hypothetical protein
MPLFDLKKNLVFVRLQPSHSTIGTNNTLQYGAYHRDPTNVAIHIACVPLLLATGALFVHSPQTFSLSSRPSTAC